MTKIATRSEALALANKIANRATEEDFTPFEFKVSFEKKRSSEQNRYYWGVVVDLIEKERVSNGVGFLAMALEAVKQGSGSPEFVHELLKLLYGGGKSTASKDAEGFIHYLDNIRQGALHYMGLDIPEPESAELRESYNDYIGRTKGGCNE